MVDLVTATNTGYAVLKGLTKIWPKLKQSKEIWFPSDKKLQKELQNPQTRTQIQKVYNNCLFVHANGQYGIKDVFTPDVKNSLKEILEKPISKKGSLRLCIFNNDFAGEAIDYDEFYDTAEIKTLDKICPFLSEEHYSILNLAAYADKHYKSRNNRKAEEIKEDISFHYGSRGRKLANLYCRGYITNAIETFFLPSIEKTNDIIKIKELTKAFIEDLISHADSIFFISKHSNAREIAEKIIGLVKNKCSYIALHSVNQKNIKKVHDILEIVLKEEIESQGYTISTKNPRMVNPNFTAFEVFFILK